MFDQKQDPKYFKESSKTVDTFIQHTHESNIKKFFMEDIDILLDKYDPGKPEMKPDVLKQIKEIEAKRAQMIKDHEEAQKQNGPIMLTREGQPPIQLTNMQVVQIMEQHKKQITDLSQKNEQSTRFNQLLQQKVVELTKNSNKSVIQDTTKDHTQLIELTKKNEELQRFTQVLQQKVIELTKQNSNNIKRADDNLEKEQLIIQIRALTNRNEVIEEQLLKANNTITALQSSPKNNNENITIHSVDNTIPEIPVQIVNDD